METNLIAKQTLQLYHAALTQTLDATLAVQNQSQKALESLLDQTPGIPAEGWRAINDWIEACRHQTEVVKSVIDEGFNPYSLLRGVTAAGSSYDQYLSITHHDTRKAEESSCPIPSTR